MNAQPLTPKEQRQRTYLTLYETYGARRSGIFGTLTAIYYLTIAYFVDYPKYLIYWEILEFLAEKQEEQ